MTDLERSPRRFHLRRSHRLTLAGAALLALGGGVGAATVAVTRPSVTMAPATPSAIRSLAASDGIVTVRGRVAEVFGDRFVVADPTGRALVDAARGGNDSALVATGQVVSVQGRFDRGVMHAAFLVGADGKVSALGPLGGPPHGRHGPPDRGCAPDGPPPGGPGAPPPPPPGVGPGSAPSGAAAGAPPSAAAADAPPPAAAPGR